MGLALRHRVTCYVVSNATISGDDLAPPTRIEDTTQRNQPKPRYTYSYTASVREKSTLLASLPQRPLSPMTLGPFSRSSTAQDAHEGPRQTRKGRIRGTTSAQTTMGLVPGQRRHRQVQLWGSMPVHIAWTIMHSWLLRASLPASRTDEIKKER